MNNNLKILAQERQDCPHFCFQVEILKFKLYELEKEFHYTK